MYVVFVLSIVVYTALLSPSRILHFFEASIKFKALPIDPFHIVISLSNRSSIEKSIKPFLKMKGQIA